MFKQSRKRPANSLLEDRMSTSPANRPQKASVIDSPLEDPTIQKFIDKSPSPSDLHLENISDKSKSPLQHETVQVTASGQSIRSAPPTPNRPQTQWVQIHHEMQKFLKLDPSPDIFEDTIKYMKAQRDEMSKRRRIVNRLPELNQQDGESLEQNLDPLTFPKTGRKANKRLKSKME